MGHRRPEGEPYAGNGSDPDDPNDRSNRFGYPEDESGQPMCFDGEGREIAPGKFVEYLKWLETRQKGEDR